MGGASHCAAGPPKPRRRVRVRVSWAVTDGCWTVHRRRLGGRFWRLVGQLTGVGGQTDDGRGPTNRG